MNRLPILFLGIFALFATSWLGLVAYPYVQLGSFESERSPATGELAPLTSSAAAGARVYAENGCIYCHSQQVRPAWLSTDIEKGLGTRQTVARDYWRERPSFLGTMRTGPDLANIGVRQTSARWHFEHLYEPGVVSPGSIMPAFRFLFVERPVGAAPSPEALTVRGPHRPRPGNEILPTPAARDLVAYLLSLQREQPLPEAAAPPPPSPPAMNAPAPPPPDPPEDEKWIEPPAPPAGGEIDLARVHGSILREHHEPQEGREGVPLWFVTLIMALVFWGGLYLANNAGGFRADVFNPSPTLAARRPADPATLGQRVYLRNCAVCHQADGQGVPRQYPPLAGSEWVLAQDWRGDNHLVNILLHGLEGPLVVRGQVYNGAMPPWKFLRDEDLAAVLSYLRTSWGNAAPPLGPDFVKRLREQTAGRPAPWSQRELKGLPREMAPPPPKRGGGR